MDTKTGKLTSKTGDVSTKPRYDDCNAELLLFDIDNAIFEQHQQIVIKQFGGLKSLISAALSNEPISLHSNQIEFLKQFQSPWHPEISPFINKCVYHLSDLVETTIWPANANKSRPNDLEETIAAIIFEYAASYEKFVKLPPSTTAENVFSIGVNCISEVVLHGINNTPKNVNKTGIVDGMKVWIDRDYRFGQTSTIPELKNITTYFMSNCKSNGIGCSPQIELKRAQYEDSIYLFVNNADRDGGWYESIPQLGWINIGSVSWIMSGQDQAYNVWKYQMDK